MKWAIVGLILKVLCSSCSGENTPALENDAGIQNSDTGKTDVRLCLMRDVLMYGTPFRRQIYLT